MTRIDFAFDARDRLRVACEAVHRHYLAGRRLLVYCTDARTLDRFDAMLWGLERTAFVPHVRADDDLAAVTPVHLLSRPPEGKDAVEAWLLNLDAAPVPDARRYARVLEIVSREDDDRTQARERWRVYKSQGHELHAHDLGSRRAASP